MSGEIPIDLNPIREVRRKSESAFIIERTPERPVTLTEIHVIADVRAEIAKYEAVISVWQDKIDPLQAIIDEWETVTEPKV